MKKIYRIVIIVIAVIALISGGFYGYKRYKRYKSYKEDAVFLLDFLENNYPYFQVKEKVLNYKFLDYKEEFIKKAARSKDDLDFYKNIDEIIYSLQNAHTAITNDPCFLAKLNNNDVEKKMEYWIGMIVKSIYLPDIRCKYVEGKYIVDKSRNKDIPVGSIITKFNGKEINDYVQSKKGTFYLHKDSKRNLFYADANRWYKFDKSKDNIEIMHNGEKRKADIKYTRINEEIQRWYCSIQKHDENNVDTDILNNGKIAYLRIKSFAPNNYETDWSSIKEFLKKCHRVNYIVIDIRGNGGGGNGYGDFLIRSLTDKEISINYYNCFKNTELMKDNSWFNNNLRQINSSEVPKNNYNLEGFKVFKQTQNIEPYKDSIKFKGNIYILVDESVYSASEYFVDIAKRSGFAKIIGTTTGGDGTGFEPIATYLPNSKLVVKMLPAFTISDDGTVNEEIHTEPDIYIEQGLEDYKNFLKSGLQDITRSEYDTVYIKTLEMIKKITLE